MEMFAILTISIQHRGCTISYCNFARCSHWGKLSKAYMESLCIISHNCTAAAAAKSLQSCLTLCDPIDGSPPGSPVPCKNTGVGCHFLLQCMKVKSEREVAQSCPTLHNPRSTAAYQAPLSMGFSRQEYWSGVPSPSPSQLYMDL